MKHLTMQSVLNYLEEATRMNILKVDWKYTENIMEVLVGTVQYNFFDWLKEALGNHAPPAISGRQIKIRYITQHSTRPPSFVAFCSKPESLPKSYLKYLTNSLRVSFDLPGVPIRLTMRKGDNPYKKESQGR